MKKEQLWWKKRVSPPHAEDIPISFSEFYELLISKGHEKLIWVLI